MSKRPFLFFQEPRAVCLHEAVWGGLQQMAVPNHVWQRGDSDGVRGRKAGQALSHLTAELREGRN